MLKKSTIKEAESERVISPGESVDDKTLDITLRPQSLSEFVGQEKIKESLLIFLQAAKNRRETMDHILFYGPPGIGKTSLANIIAREMQANLKSTSGPAIERAGDLIGILTNLGDGDILFIDEIHRLSKVVEEFLYPAMESFKIDFVVDKGPYAKTINFNLSRLL
jgi:Holliday junction DNA helicase RuvB